MTISRRDLLLGATGLAAAGSVASPGQVFAQAAAGAPKYTPEPGATLRLLRWAPFVKGDDESWLANTKKFSDATGVQVRVDKESWEDIRPKAAVAANVGSGPDLMLVWFDDPHQYPDKLLDLTDLGDYLGSKYGGWYEGPKSYATREGKF
ncbi:MAG TPA: extracellular solute-binding protein, partial [Salinarimonas sp.]|nr:extracellular solute-binding protein [Salinarimonas sp.]